MQNSLIAFGVATMLAGSALAQDAPAGTPSVPKSQLEGQTPTNSPNAVVSVDRDFIEAAAMSDKLEMEAAKIALARSSRPEVKAYAQMMLDHHGTSTQQLNKIASDLNERPPTMLDDDKTAMLAMLEKHDAGSFDAAYADAMVKSHVETLARVRLFQVEGKQQNLKVFAAAQAPVVEKHVTEAQALQAKVGKAAS